MRVGDLRLAVLWVAVLALACGKGADEEGPTEEKPGSVWAKEGKPGEAPNQTVGDPAPSRAQPPGGPPNTEAGPDHDEAEPPPAEEKLPPEKRSTKWTVEPGGPSATVEVRGAEVRLLDATGQKLARLSPMIVTAYGRDAATAWRLAESDRVDRTKPGAWSRVPGRNGGWSLRSRARVGGADWGLAIHGAPGDPRLVIEATINYVDPTWVGVEGIELEVHDTHRLIVDRRVQVRKLDRRVVVGAWSPQLAFFGRGARALTVMGSAQSLVATPDGEGARLRFEADHAENHPLRRFQNCWPKYASVQEKKRDPVGAIHRKPGDDRHAHTIRATVVVGNLDALRTLRFPEGRRAALVITDHADQSSLGKLGALMYGEGFDDRAPTGKSRRGFAARGLSMTKTVFHRDTGKPYAPQLADGHYQALVKRMVADGVEVGPHSVSGIRDTKEQTEASLEEFKRVTGDRSHVWVDHQPSTNCEAIANEGATPGSKWYIVDLLKRYGYRYVWATFDVRRPADGINLLDPDRPGQRRPVLYKHPNIDPDGQLWLFPSVWRAVPYERLLKLYSKAKLARLEADYGIHIAHTYIDTWRKRGGMAKWTVLERTATGYRLKAAADDLFAELARRQSAGGARDSGGDRTGGKRPCEAQPKEAACQGKRTGYRTRRSHQPAGSD